MALATAIRTAAITESKSPFPATSETIKTSWLAFIIRLMESPSTILTTQIPGGFGHALIDSKEAFKKICGLDEGVAHRAVSWVWQNLETVPSLEKFVNLFDGGTTLPLS